MKQIKISEYVYERLTDVKETSGHTSFDSALRELLYGYTGNTWHQKVALVKARDNYRCRGCGISELEQLNEHGRSLSVHHIEHRHEFDDKEKMNQMDNLLTLCDSCHTKLEPNGWSLEEIGVKLNR